MRSLLALVVLTFKVDPWRTSVTIFLRGLWVACSPLTAVGLALLVAAARPGSTWHRAWPAIMILAIALGGHVFLFELSRKISHLVQEKLRHELECEILRIVAGLPQVDHLENAEILNKIERIHAEYHSMVSALNEMLDFSLTLVAAPAMLALLASQDRRLLILPLCAVPSLVLNARAERRRLSMFDATTTMNRRAADLVELATSPIAGKELRIFGLGDVLTDRYQNEMTEVAITERRAFVLAAIIQVPGRLIFAGGFLLSVAWVTLRVAHGSLPISALVLTLVLANRLMGALSSISRTASWLTSTVAAMGRFLWLRNYARRLTPASAGVPPPPRINEYIELADVQFAYPGTSPVVLDNLSLRLPTGAIVAVVGENGAGKTTLVKLLAGLHTPTSGEIRIDGRPLAEMDLPAWRQRISAAFQDHLRLELTAQRSVGLGDLPQLDDPTAVLDAIERAAANDVLAHMPTGLETQLGAAWEGIDLSGGQWQKLAIARSLMRQHPLLLILDEPTAALDAEAEHRLFETYAIAAAESSRRSGTITVLVSHRFSTVRMADLIVVLDAGRIVESGTHDQLISHDGTYAELFSMQAGAYR